MKSDGNVAAASRRRAGNLEPAATEAASLLEPPPPTADNGSDAGTFLFLAGEIRVAQTFELSVNGAAQSVQTDPERSLLSVLRDDLGLTGAKYGCGEGQCGACTVLIDGQAKRSCITPVSECTGKQIGTIEGLAPDGELHPLQAAFLDCDALQCGYCTTGMIMTASALLERTPDPSPQDILRAMNGNICRCGTYARITAAIQQAAQAAKA